MPDHVHMLVSIPPKYSISRIMGYIKGKSAMMIFERHANLKYKFGNREFLGNGILCEYSGAKYCNHTKVYTRTGQAGSDRGFAFKERVSRPFEG